MLTKNMRYLCAIMTMFAGISMAPDEKVPPITTQAKQVSYRATENEIECINKIVWEMYRLTSNIASINTKYALVPKDKSSALVFDPTDAMNLKKMVGQVSKEVSLIFAKNTDKEELKPANIAPLVSDIKTTQTIYQNILEKILGFATLYSGEHDNEHKERLIAAIQERALPALELSSIDKQQACGIFKTIMHNLDQIFIFFTQSFDQSVSELQYDPN